jgi:hypothetical protein
MRHRAAALVAVAAGVLSAAAPASAETNTVERYSNSTNFGVTQLMPLLDPTVRPLVVTGRGQNLGTPVSGAKVNITFECAAAGLSTFTTVLQCYLKGADGRVIPAVETTGGLPAPADATGGTAVNVPAQQYKVCVQARADVQSVQGTEEYTTSLICG